MLALDMSMEFETIWLLYSFLVYFFCVIFYIILRFYFLAKSYLLLLLFAILGILYNYYVMYFHTILGGMELHFTLLNFHTNSSLITFNLSFTINKLTYLFSLLVLIIGFCTNMYTLNYFKNEADEMGFLFWLNSFIVSMLILVLSSNFLTTFLGWELIGFTSFFLINFWQSRRATLKSSFKAFTFNLVSDIFLLGFMVILYNQFHSSQIDVIISLVTGPSLMGGNWLIFSSLLLISCASIKSVQIIGHLWLPDSMEAPVPASSLIHSATLVSAGVFLILRFNALIVETGCQIILINLGALTAAYGGVVASAQTDVKKLLAYSTMSHCGFLFILAGLGNCYITIIYLFLHGLFKASTFFCVGSFIRTYGTQDTRLMGSGARILFGDSLFLIICAINLCGLPLTIGFVYKFFFFKIFFTGVFNSLTLGLVYIGLLSSLIYFFRLIYFSIFDKWKVLWGTSPFLFQAFETQWWKDRRASLFYDHYSASRVTTFGHWFALFLLFICIFYIYANILYFTTEVIKLDDFVDNFNLRSNFINLYFFQFYTTYLVYFYFFYTLIFLILILLTWRKNFFFFDKLTFYIFLLIFSLLFIFY